MKAIIRGIATIPNIYRSVGGVDVAFRGTDVISLADGYVESSVPMVINHDDTSFGFNKGTLLRLGYNEYNQLTYEAEITDSYVIEQLLKLKDEQKIPNVSPMLVPICDSINKVTLDDGSEVYYSDDWVITHLSIVNKGRCDDTQGCGVHDIEIILEDINYDVDGDTDMSETELETVKLELEALKKDLDIIKGEKEAAELKLSEVTSERDTYVKAEEDELKALILTHNKEAKFPEGITVDGLKIVLGALEDVATGKGKAEDPNAGKSKTALKLEEMKKKRNDKFNLK